MPSPARVRALEVLQAVGEARSTLADLLARDEVASLEPRERAFLHELVLGTLRARGEIDFALESCLDRPLARVEAPVRDALRLGAHQILNLRVPDRAAVSESVELARRERPQAAGFVNAVLRRLARQGPPALPDPEQEPLRWLGTGGSLPAWLAERWLRVLGPTTAVARARALREAPAAAFRLNPHVQDAPGRLQAAEVAATPGLVPGSWRATAGRPAPLHDEGVLYLQDEASQLVARLAAGPGRRLDACAAPGGKALLMADLAGGDGRVFAAEVSRRRLGTLADLCARWGAPNLHLLAADATQPPFVREFAAVLLDAPCSGLGTLARHPDLRWRTTAADLPRHAARQRALLESLARSVARGGLLVYSVCSSEPEEGEDVVSGFLAAHPEFRTEDAPEWAAAFQNGPYVRTLPERDGTDAFFAALLRRS